MRLTSLTSLRFFAALGVFFHHFHFYAESKSEILKILYKFFFEGFIGVTFFYILSGFIISFSYEQHKQKGTYRISDFLYNRFSRLYPTHLITLLAAIIIYVKIDYLNTIDIKNLLANLFLVQSAIPNPAYFFNFNGVSWSVSTEMFFYISFIFLVTLNTKQLIVLSSLLLSIILFHMYQVPQTPRFYGWTYYVNPAFRVIDFMIGMLLCRLFLTKKVIIEGSKATLLEILSLILIIVFATFGINNIPMQWRYDIYYIVPMALTVFIFAYGNGAISKMLTNKWLVLFGEASFSLYMIHQIIITVAINHLNVNIDSARSVIPFMISVVTFGVLASCFMYKFYEYPINTWLRKKRFG